MLPRAPRGITQGCGSCQTSSLGAPWSRRSRTCTCTSTAAGLRHAVSCGCLSRLTSSHWFLTLGAPCCSPQQSWANRGEGLSRSYSYYLDHARSGPRPGACVINGVGHGGHTHMQKRAAAKTRGLLRFCISEWLEITMEEVCYCARVDLRVRLSLASSHSQCAQLRLRHCIQ